MPKVGKKSKSKKNGGKTVSANETMEASQRSTRRSNGGRGEKRLRRSTGGSSVTMPNITPNNNVLDNETSQSEEGIISMGQFKSMSTDDKLVTLFGLMTHVNEIATRVDMNEKTLHNEIHYTDENTRRIKLLEYKSIDLEARSRRNNLVIRGIQESRDENCESKVLSFIHDKLQLDHHNFAVQRAHRIGKAGGGRNRPLIVCFRDYTSVTEVLKNAHKLRGTNYSVSKDFPIEIAAARTKLWPLYKQAKQANPMGSVKLEYPARLRVNGRVIKDEFPDWNNILSGHRIGPATYDRRSHGSSSAIVDALPGGSGNKRRPTGVSAVPTGTVNQASLQIYLEDTESDTDIDSPDDDSTDADSEADTDAASQSLLGPPTRGASGVSSNSMDTTAAK